MRLQIDQSDAIQIIKMLGANLVNLLSQTLESGTISISSAQLQRRRQTSGFTTELLTIVCTDNINPSIRQSAVTYLKNTIQDHISSLIVIPSIDMDSLKQNLVRAINMTITNKLLAPTFKQIAFQLAEKYYPHDWCQLVNEPLELISSSNSFDELFGSVQILKAVFSVFGGSIMREIELSNISNRAFVPLLTLTSNLFQNFNDATVYILISVMKLYSTCIQFHLPKIVQLNIHSLMIFVKKILDLNLDVTAYGGCIYQLKKICLRILFRIYQRHANPKITDYKQFASQFQSKYTKSFVQSLIGFIMVSVHDDTNSDKVFRKRQLELVKLSLSCLAYVNRVNADESSLLLQHRNTIIGLCLQNFKLKFGRNYQNFNDFKMYIQENRIHLKQFLYSLMRCEALPNEQRPVVTSILVLLHSYLQKQDQLKQLVLYIFAQMSTQIQYLQNSLDDDITALIVENVKPLLDEKNHLLVRMRACQLIASYNHLQLPKEHLTDIAAGIYNCLLVGNSEKQTFLKIYACNAFNSILKYQQIVEFVKPNLKDILKIYTSLLETDISIIKNFEDIINLLEQQIHEYANDLVSLLIIHFNTYSKQNQQQSAFGGKNYNQIDNDADDDDDSQAEQDDSNNENIAKACISSIRQILQAQKTVIDPNIRQELYMIVIKVFLDEGQLYLQEGFNILNLLLYKLKENIDSKYYLFLKVIIYSILGVPNNYINNLKSNSNNNNDKQFGMILSNICVNPDEDFLQNSIGSIRNFIAKSTNAMLMSQKDDFNVTIMEYLFKLVNFVHIQNKNASQTDRLIILTIYITMIQYKVLNKAQLQLLIDNVMTWMYQQYVSIEGLNDIDFFNAKTQVDHKKVNQYIYSPVYLQIIMLCGYFYPAELVSRINIDIVIYKLAQLEQRFKCDYELMRIIIGLCNLLAVKAIIDQRTLEKVAFYFPELIRRACSLRQENDQKVNQIEIEDEAEQDKFFGDDDNSMMIGWKQNQMSITQKDLQLRQGEDQESDNEWEEQFNKFYVSPLDGIDEIKFAEQVLKFDGNYFCAYIQPQYQPILLAYFANAPPKFKEHPNQ